MTPTPARPKFTTRLLVSGCWCCTVGAWGAGVFTVARYLLGS